MRSCPSVRPLSLIAALAGCASVLAVTAGAGLAQDMSANVTVLDPIVLEAVEGDDDAGSIVATTSSAGGRLAAPLLDTPASVSVITSREIAERGAQGVEEVLQYSAGVVADFYGADDRFDYFKIRGFDAYAARDGLSLGRPFGGIREETYAFERVEVVRGAISTATGLSDPGGSVNYVTKLPRRARFGEVYGTVGSHDRGEIGFDLGDNFTPDATLSWRLTGKLREADAEYDESRDDAGFLMGGLTWRPSEATSLSVVVDRLDLDGVPGSGGHPIGTDFDRSRFFGEPGYNFRGTERTSVTALLDHDFGTGLSASARLRYSDTASDYGYAYIAATPTDGSTIATRSFFGNDSALTALIGTAQLQYDTSVGGTVSRSVVGVEFADRDRDNDTFFGPAPGIDWTDPVPTGAPDEVPLIASSRNEQRGRAIFAEQELTFADRFIVTAGLRHDWLDITETDNLAGTAAEGEISETTGKLGLTYKVTDQVSTYASYAQSVVPAGIGVEPEEGRQVELGVKVQPIGTNALFSAALYDLTRTNLTRTDPVTLLPQTLGEVRARGLDLEAKAEIAPAISLTAAYSWLDQEIVENGTAGNEGNRPQLVPEHSASLWATYTLAGQGGRGDMTFSLGGRYTGQYFYDDANTVGTGGTVVVDAAYGWQLQDNTSLALNVSNLFDRKYVANGGFGADFYNPGRQVAATLRRTW